MGTPRSPHQVLRERSPIPKEAFTSSTVFVKVEPFESGVIVGKDCVNSWTALYNERTRSPNEGSDLTRTVVVAGCFPGTVRASGEKPLALHWQRYIAHRWQSGPTTDKRDRVMWRV